MKVACRSAHRKPGSALAHDGRKQPDVLLCLAKCSYREGSIGKQTMREHVDAEAREGEPALPRAGMIKMCCYG